MNGTTLNLQQRLIGTHPHWWLGAMLLALHYALAWGIDDWLARAMLLAHFGLFLMWQPAWRGERLEPRHAILVVTAGLLLAAWNNWWLMAVWLALLFALIGGNLFGSQQPRQRLVAILAALDLLSLLLVWVVPHLFADQRFEPPLTLLVQYGLQLLPILIIVIPIPAGRTPPAAGGGFRLWPDAVPAGHGTGAGKLRRQAGQSRRLPARAGAKPARDGVAADYAELVVEPAQRLYGYREPAVALPDGPGLPFERWVRGLAELAEREREPARFLALALHDMCELPWVAGVAWQAPHGSGELGARSRFRAECSFQDLTLTFHATWPLSPALQLHLKLLTQMLGHFYEAKRREEMQRHNAYTQAIYETGARLTHDVKNLLQSLRTLCAAAESSDAGQAAALQELIKRQLPQIAQRLSTTLEKLRESQQAATAQTDAVAWWEKLKQRYPRSEIAFSGDEAMAGLSLPGELFDSVAENLLQNALAKAQQQSGIRVSVLFQSVGGGRLTICDTGNAIPKSVATRLFAAPVPSQTGLGIGLYQAAKQAQQLGCKLTLVSNSDGRVCFELARAASYSNSISKQ